MSGIPDHDDQLSPIDGVPAPHLPEGDPALPNSGGTVRRATDAQETAVDPVLEEVRAVHRAALAVPSSNVVSGLPHFARVVDGQAVVCGGCGDPWPCTAWAGLQTEVTV